MDEQTRIPVSNDFLQVESRKNITKGDFVLVNQWTCKRRSIEVLTEEIKAKVLKKNDFDTQQVPKLIAFLAF